MAGTRTSSFQKREKEAHGRDVIRRWQESGLSQAAFCRKEGIKENSFSNWKRIIVTAGAKISPASHTGQSLPSRSSKKVVKRSNNAMKALAVQPKFVRLEVETKDSAAKEVAEASLPRNSESDEPTPIVAAELILPTSRRRLRIFNAADHSTLSALTAALALMR